MPEEISLFSLTTSQSCLRQTNILHIYLTLLTTVVDGEVPVSQFLLHAFHARSEKFVSSHIGDSL